MKTGNELGFGFGKIERNAVRLSNRSDQVNDEAERLVKDVPTRTVPPGLVLDYLSEIESARHHDDADQAEAQRELVRDHLCRRTQAAHQAVLVVRRPAREHDAVHADRRDAEHVEQTDIEPRDRQRDRDVGKRNRDVGAERVDDHRHQRGHRGDHGREEVDESG